MEEEQVLFVDENPPTSSCKRRRAAAEDDPNTRYPRQRTSPSTKLLNFTEAQPVVTVNINTTLEDGEVIIHSQPVHKSLLASSSRYFANLFNRPSVTQDGGDSITLQNTYPESFGLLLNWLYFKKVEKDGERLGLTKLTMVWELGERYGMPALQNSVMNLMVPAIERVLKTPKFIAFAYNEDTGFRRKMLRKLVVSKVLSMPINDYQKIIQTLPQALMYEVLMAMKRHVSQSVPEKHKPVLGAPAEFYVQATPISID